MQEERRKNMKRRSNSERRQTEDHPESDIYMFERRTEERRSGIERRNRDLS